MSDNPFEEGNTSPRTEKKTLAQSIQDVKNMSITRALSQLRWINFFLALIVIVLKIFGFFAGFNIYSILLNCFCILFCGILALYELQMKKLTKKFRVLYGFLYTYIGRAAYVVFVGTIVIASGNMLNVIIGFVVIVVGLYNVFIVVLHPAFKKEGRKISDDPTVAYSAGESEITNALRKNPNLAQKVLVGASKIAA